MNAKQWKYFSDFKETFKNKISEWNNNFPQLMELQKQAAEADNNPPYSFETPIVYNRDLDKITIDDDIRLIVIGDNPGKDEQLTKNNRYLVGQAGKIADGFFKRNPELNIDFRKNVIILNKTPVHSARTSQLKHIIKAGGPSVEALISESQIWMAQKTAELQINLSRLADSDKSKPELWMVGYSELREKHFFCEYRDNFKNNYLEKVNGGQTPNFIPEWNSIFVFQHFSMNRFSIDLNDFIAENQTGDRPLIENIHTLGNKHKKEIFI